MTDVVLERFDGVEGFLAAAGSYLEAHEAEHCVVLGICSNVLAGLPVSDGPIYYAVVRRGDAVVGAAIRTPPHNLILAHPGEGAADAVAGAVVEDLGGSAGDGHVLPGVVGSTLVVPTFAERWAARAGVEATLLRTESAYRLEAVRAPARVPGARRLATPEDRDVLIEQVAAFMREAFDSDDAEASRVAAGAMVDLGRGGRRTFHLWDDGGVLVSIAGITGPTPNGIRVGPVYTPPEYRGRGYASALVADASQSELDAGRRYVFLFADHANPTANHIYRTIGFVPMADVQEFSFG